VDITRFRPGVRYSGAVVFNGIAYLAGQVASETIGQDVSAQTEEVLRTVDAVLAECGTDKSRLLSVTIYLPHITDFDAMNAVWDKWVDKVNLPARATVEARLADPRLRIELVAIAALR
jgi:enamine deaminase RidA (YjgF/YER057c/UK114 family)